MVTRTVSVLCKVEKIPSTIGQARNLGWIIGSLGRLWKADVEPCT